MANKIRSIERHNFSRKEQLFLDANIWIYVYGPQGPNDRKNRIYSSALANILRANAAIYIDVLVLSEFVNATREWSMP
jgi:predicted nucleic acid-binding protein